jgi:hypothetical protein
MSQQHQVKFRASDRFLGFIKSECMKREMSLQDLITAALKVYMETPVDWTTASFITFDEENTERYQWVEHWVDYIEKMPREKALLMVEVMKLDLLHYKSSRRKADLKKHQATPKVAGKHKGR